MQSFACSGEVKGSIPAVSILFMPGSGMKFCRLEDDPGGVSCSGYYLFWSNFFGNPFQYSQEHVMAVIFGSNCKGLQGIVGILTLFQGHCFP